VRKMDCKLTHLITGLNTGGAEMMLYRLLSKLDHKKFNVSVISLTDVGPVGEKIKELDIPVIGLGMKRGTPNPFFLFKLANILRKEKPDILQTWMYHADLMGLLAGRMAGIKNIVWGIHHSNLSPESNKKMTIKVAEICAGLSKYTSKIICCSESSLKIHNGMGYYLEKMIVIPNGFNIQKFSPIPKAKEQLKSQLSISKNAFLVGLVARWDPLKDHHNFIKAAKIVAEHLPNIHFVLCGDNIDVNNDLLMDWIKNTKAEELFHLMGRREDIGLIMPAFDLLVLSSKGEAFPNVLGEAMACEVPCVATNVGDSVYIVGDTGFVVPPENPQALADAIIRCFSLPIEEREQLGKRARKRVESNFKLELVVEKYEHVYLDLLQMSERR